MTIITILAIIAAGAVAGILFLVYRNVSEKVVVVPQNTTTITQDMITAMPKTVRGSFGEVDAVHKGRGEAVIYATSSGPVLRLENFSVTPGPDLVVYLSKEKSFSTTRDLGSYVSLGKLQKFKGEQVYSLPADYVDYATVIIWCRAFSVLFSFATLQ